MPVNLDRSGRECAGYVVVAGSCVVGRDRRARDRGGACGGQVEATTGGGAGGAGRAGVAGGGSARRSARGSSGTAVAVPGAPPEPPTPAVASFEVITFVCGDDLPPFFVLDLGLIESTPPGRFTSAPPEALPPAAPFPPLPALALPPNPPVPPLPPVPPVPAPPVPPRPPKPPVA